MRDAIVVALLIASFATLVTTHVAVAVRLLWRQPRYRALVALVVPPLAVWWAWAERWRWMSALWVGAVGVYVIALVIASF